MAPGITVPPASAAGGIPNCAALRADSVSPSPGIPTGSELDVLGDMLPLRSRGMPRLHRVATDQLFDLDGVGEVLAPNATPGNRFRATAWFV
jgi:hypothetical protein